ncbi:hypothetical protein [Catelliglobosispora koreensis]|uniref:hypothetical protein n=1 Tax=Catelliglobosispora koreensis TaxID=129052 RepID=UPI00036F2719|nr:hypothetical protein [Catelliglobosispora koreensis]
MVDLSARLSAAGADLGAMNDAFDRAGPVLLPAVAGGLATVVEGAWAAQLAESQRLADEVRELAAAVRLAAQRYVDADQEF